jgi:spore germination protein YaaH
MAVPGVRLERPGRPVVLVGLILVLAAIVAAGVWDGHDAREGGPHASGGQALGSAAAEPSVRPVPGHEVYAFVPYWEMDGTIAAHVSSADVTTVGLFSVTHTGSGKLATGQGGYQRITGPIGRALIADAHAHHRRAEIAYTSFGRAKNTKLFGNVALQDRVIAALAELRKRVGADGIAVDVEDIDDADILAFGGFVGRLRTALQTAAPNATVTVATTAGVQGAALAAAANLAGADRIFLMGYDYRTASSEPGASAPLARTDGGQRTLAWSLDLYAAAGVPSTRLLLGLPLYGVAWPVDSPDLGAPATGKGAVWIPRQNLGTLHDGTLQPVVDPVEQVAFLAIPDGAVWRAVYYDTPATLAPKLALADDRGLAGAGLWALGYDRGLSGYRELIGDFRAGRLADSGTPASAPPALP